MLFKSWKLRMVTKKGLEGRRYVVQGPTATCLSELFGVF